MTKETTTRLEEKGMSQRSEDLLQVYKTLTFDLPLVSMRWTFGSANDKESTIAVWKGYDAGVRLATSTIDSLYRSQSLSEIVGNTVNQMLLHHAQTPPVPPSQMSELPIPRELEAVLMMCLEKKAAQRPASALELEARLARIRIERPWTQEDAREWWDAHAPDALVRE